MKRSGVQDQSESPGDSRSGKAKRRRNNPDESCRTCRLRKVKCSGKTENGPCLNCSRLKLNCPFTQHDSGSQDTGRVARITPNGTVTEAGTLRKRAQRACLECHGHKTKCSGDLPSCTRCQTNDLKCEYVPAKRKFANVPGHSNSVDGQTPPSAVPFPNGQLSPEVSSDGNISSDIFLDPSPAPQTRLIKRDVILKHVDAYFDYFFHMPCMNFLHPVTVYRWVEEDNFPPHLAAAICSISSSLVSTVSPGRALAARWNEQVEYYVFQNLVHLEPELLLYHVLVTVYNWMYGPWSKVWMYVSTAARLIRCLQLNYDPDIKANQVNFSQQEIQRRSVWQIYLIDHFLSGGFDEHLLLPSNSMHVRLPCSDQVFKDGLPSMMETLVKNPAIQSNPNDYSLDAYHVKILTIRREVLSLSKRFTSASPTEGEPLRAEQVMDIVNRYQITLNRFNETLPDRLKLTEVNVYAHLDRPDRPSYVMLHTWICQTVMDLYRFSLPNAKGSTYKDHLARIPQEFLLRSQQQAVAHAVSLAQFWTYSLEMIQNNASTVSKGVVTVDWMVGACAVEVTTILLTARKYELYRGLRDGSSAQLCRSRDVDDDMLETLIAKVILILETLKPLLPRIESYLEQAMSKIRQFEDERSRSASRSPLIRGLIDSELATGSNLPGPDNIIIRDDAGSKTYPTSMSERFLRKKSESFVSKTHVPTAAQMAVAATYAVDLPTIPFCLEQARGVPSSHPNSSQPQVYHDFGNLPMQNSVVSPILMADASDREGMATASAQMMLPLHHGPDSRENNDYPMHGPSAIMAQDDRTFNPYAPPVVFQNGESQYLWTQDGQRNDHV
ncbi:uncharacterized protein BCR38DRAFT_99560 [Pseudomassariella vexata]|uniref:Zn(2)-C6 fungal-type domain-containing protein n=1 Tax=Pseudomassariella vexata TaxID=1141098 RepID=A0A1Y2EH32_9PEZI|nr:uncharacterized protein BCR38DRAFT_99560 [Pseudomassariella vexata]ORY70095.1 hypothetical protein BCR38DRAFT_99560 [Pseudomassariella vexata]